MDCSAIEETLVHGGRVDEKDPQVAEHLRGCATCRFLVGDGAVSAFFVVTIR